MTHDELLLNINRAIDYTSLQDGNVNMAREIKALRAVVELLKGYNDGQTRVNEEFNQGVLALSNVIKEAIEKELG